MAPERRPRARAPGRAGVPRRGHVVRARVGGRRRGRRSARMSRRRITRRSRASARTASSTRSTVSSSAPRSRSGTADYAASVVCSPSTPAPARQAGSSATWPGRPALCRAGLPARRVHLWRRSPRAGRGAHGSASVYRSPHRQRCRHPRRARHHEHCSRARLSLVGRPSSGGTDVLLHQAKPAGRHRRVGHRQLDRELGQVRREHVLAEQDGAALQIPGHPLADQHRRTDGHIEQVCVGLGGRGGADGLGGAAEPAPEQLVERGGLDLGSGESGDETPRDTRRRPGRRAGRRPG